MNSCSAGVPENNLKLPEQHIPSRDTVIADLSRYQQLLPDNIREFEPTPDYSTLNLQVMGHHILSVDGVIISFDTGRERFAFNRFCDYTDIPGSQRELSSLIEFWDAMPPESRTHWMDSLRAAITKLQDASGVPLISLEDGVEYLTYPNIVIDRPQKSQKASVIEVSLPDEIFVPQQRDPYKREASVRPPYERASTEERVTIIGKVAGMYMQWPDVWRSIKEYEAERDNFTQKQDLDLVYSALEDIEAGLMKIHELGGLEILPDLPTDAPPEELLQLTTSYHTLVAAFRPLVVTIAEKRKPTMNLSLHDCIQEGYVELMRVIASYDRQGIGRRCTFPTYAKRRINYHLLNVGARTRAFSFSNSAIATLSAIHTSREKLTLELRRTPTHDELAKATGHTTQQLSELLAVDQFYLPSLDQSYEAGNSDKTLASTLAKLPAPTYQSSDVPKSKLDQAQDIFFSDTISESTKFFMGLKFGMDPSLMPDISLEIPDGSKLSYYEAYEQLLDLGPTPEGINEIARITGWNARTIRGRLKENFLKLRKLSGKDEL